MKNNKIIKSDINELIQRLTDNNKLSHIFNTLVDIKNEIMDQELLEGRTQESNEPLLIRLARSSEHTLAFFSYVYIIINSNMSNEQKYKLLSARDYKGSSIFSSPGVLVVNIERFSNLVDDSGLRPQQIVEILRELYPTISTAKLIQKRKWEYRTESQDEINRTAIDKMNLCIAIIANSVLGGK